MKGLLNIKTVVSAVVGIVLGALGMGTTVATNPEYVVGWVANWYCKQDADRRLRYRDNLYEVTKPHKLIMDCNVESPK